MINQGINMVYKIYFDLDNENVETFINQIGVDIKLLEVKDDLDQKVVKFVALYAWKLVIMDRAFSNDARIFSASKL